MEFPRSTTSTLLSGITAIILQHEGVIMAMATSLFLLGFVPAALIHYAQQPACNFRSQFARPKLMISSVIFAIEFISFLLPAMLAVRCDREIPAVAALNLMAAGVVLAVTVTEDSYRLDPPKYFSSYLMAQSVIDAGKSIYYSHHGLCSTDGNLAVLAGITKLSLLCLHRVAKSASSTYRPTHDQEMDDEGICSWGFSNFAIFDPFLMFRLDLDGTLKRSKSPGPELSPNFLHQRLKYHWHNANRYYCRSLLNVCLGAWKSSLTASVALRFASSVFSLSQPFMLYHMVILHQSEPTTSEKLKILCIFSFILVGKTALSSSAAHAMNGLVYRIRGSLTCLVFEKQQNLTEFDAKAAKAEILFISDIENIARGLPQLMKLVFTFIDAFLGVYCLSYLGHASSTALLTFLLVAALPVFYFGQNILASSQAWRQDLDTRIWKTSSVLSQLTAVKMTGLGPLISDFIKKLHKHELQGYGRFRTAQSASEAGVAFFSLVAPAAVIGAVVLYGPVTATLSPAIIFATWNVVTLQCKALSTLPQAYSETILALQSFDSVQLFLSVDERRDDRSLLSSPRELNLVQEQAKPSRLRRPQTRAEDLRPTVEFQNVTVTPFGLKSPLYRNVNFTIHRGKITALVGERRSGKTSLLEAMLGEAKLSIGTAYIAADLATFNGQQVWLKNASVRDNVIGPLPFNSQRFKKVMHCCLLLEDLKKLPGSDGYIIGIAGANLSGGQRLRLALARSLYSDPSLLLIDDIFSSLDRRTAVSILFRLFGHGGGVLRESGCTVVFATSLVESFDVADQFLTLNIAENRVSLEANRRQLQIAKLLLAQHVSASEAEEEKQQEALRRKFDARNLPSFNFDRDLVPHTHRRIRAFWLLFNSIGKRKLALWSTLVILSCGLEVVSKLNLRSWIATEGNLSEFFSSYIFYVSLSGCLGLFLFWSTRIRSSSNCAIYLHSLLLETTMRSTSNFMNEAGSSSVANRFSQSISHFTGSLPTSSLKIIYYSTSLMLQCAVLLSITSYMSALLLILILCIIRTYVRTSCELRHIKAKEMAPLHIFFQETAAGTVHSRALSWQSHHLEHGFCLVDRQQKAFFYSIYIETWLQGMSSAITCAVTLAIAAEALFGEISSTTATIGLSLHQATLLGEAICDTAQSWGIFDDTWAVISDLFVFIKSVPQEREPVNADIPENWPSEGKIEFREVTARYGPDEAEVLRNVSFTIEPRQKVCFFGRTGSGKSTLLLALLGFLEYTGTIEVDGIDISTVPPAILRSRIIAIAQEPVQLEGSIRSNLLSYEFLDPHTAETCEEASSTTDFDDQLEEILDALGLWGEIVAKGGLGISMKTANFSKATTKMICFARSVVRYHRSDSTIVLIDEATNGIDEQHDAAVQEAMWELFEGCTILQVAHIEASTRDAELSIEMSKGSIVHTQRGNLVPPGVVSRSREMLSPESLIGSPGPEPPAPGPSFVFDEENASPEDDIVSLNREIPPPASDVLPISDVFRHPSLSVPSLRDSVMSPRGALAQARHAPTQRPAGFGPARVPTLAETSSHDSSPSQSDSRRTPVYRDDQHGERFGRVQQTVRRQEIAIDRLFATALPTASQPFAGPSRPRFDKHSPSPFRQLGVSGQHQVPASSQRALHGQLGVQRQQAVHLVPRNLGYAPHNDAGHYGHNHHAAPHNGEMDDGDDSAADSVDGSGSTYFR
ncbi:hypothetical protein NLG97_g2855 [Lecanicillium saksenae]|uniref:Uncharacterized protein n=1 Tax=Lecanicillium saksenae TaxID=468837 RepID=A0ACC1R305_9HYPO|nr:hypothetical protein NLG97_g2855 [Lecanicillium saksenae]